MSEGGWTKSGVIIGGISLVVGISAGFFSKEVRQCLGLESGSCVLFKSSSDNVQISSQTNSPAANKSKEPLTSSMSDSSTPVPTLSAYSRYLGWIRIGTVKNNLGRSRVGDRLINAEQPVTISPAVVPSIGNAVTIINEVNLRKSPPEKSNYTLAEKISVLLPGQIIVILKMELLTKPGLDPSYNAVWAEVAIP